MSTTPHIAFLKDAHGNSVAYATHGQGPLVICPVWWVSHVEKDWQHEPFRRFFEQLGDGLRIVRYDRPGVGLSDRDVPERSLEDEIDLLGRIAQAVGEDTYSLLAISCAGPIAIHHAASHPESIDKIVFFGSFLDGPAICPLEIQDAVSNVVRAHWGLGSRALADIFFPDADAATLDAFARQTRAAASAEAADRLLKLTYSMDAREAAEKIKADCLVIHRSGDKAIPFENGRELATTIAGARLQTLQGRAHPPWIDGDDIAHAANAFLHGRAETKAAPITDAPAQTACAFDEKNRCLMIEGKEVPLTPLEFGVMHELNTANGNVVTRDDLLERVWKQPYDGSNRIDVTISALRKKLAAWSPSIETVTGHGYRFSGWKRKS